MSEFAVVTLEGDLHAYLVEDALERRYGIETQIVAADRIAASGNLVWHVDDAEVVTLPTEDGGVVEVDELRLIWWRRCRGVPQIPDSVSDSAMRELVVKDCDAALRGVLLSAFTGKWLSDPGATQRAQNKLLQLRIARSVGLAVPRTLVSNAPNAIREFVRAQGGAAIAKTLTGVFGTALEAGRVLLESLNNDDELRLAPTIYQEEIRGENHLRVMAFGERIHAARISSGELDWRLATDMRIEPIELDVRLQRALLEVVSRLGLAMGIMDLKLTPDGDPVFLEVNPQGQFLFVEGMSEMPLADAFADFVAGELALVNA